MRPDNFKSEKACHKCHIALTLLKLLKLPLHFKLKTYFIFEIKSSKIQRNVLLKEAEIQKIKMKNYM